MAAREGEARENETDEALMESFLAGDERAFERLFERLSGPVYGFALRMVRDAASAEDVVQSVFLSLVRARGRFDRGRALRPWVFAIAANASRDVLRRRGRRPEDVAGHGDGLAAVPDRRAAAPEARWDLERALAALPEGQREVVVMHRVLGMSFEEIAQALGIGLSAAKVRAHRAEERMRDALKEGGDA